MGFCQQSSCNIKDLQKMTIAGRQVFGRLVSVEFNVKPATLSLAHAFQISTVLFVCVTRVVTSVMAFIFLK